jgi:hypothetical protein
MIKKCLTCNKEFKPRLNTTTYCSVTCYKENRKKNGWYKTPNMIKKSRGSVSRTLCLRKGKPYKQNLSSEGV